MLESDVRPTVFSFSIFGGGIEGQEERNHESDRHKK